MIIQKTEIYLIKMIIKKDITVIKLVNHEHLTINFTWETSACLICSVNKHIVLFISFFGEHVGLEF